MGTKLNIIIFLLILTSCSSSKSFKDEEKSWIDTYKASVFWSCFRESYTNDTLINIIGNKDFIFQNEIIADWNILDDTENLGKKTAKNIKKPNVYPKFEEGNKDEFYKKNYFLKNCLDYFSSKELDLIARKAYNDHLKKMKQY